MPEKVETSPKVNTSTASEASAASKETAPSYDLTKFKLKRILNNNSVRKTIALLGTFPDNDESAAAVVIFEKHAYRESDVATGAPSNEEPLKPSYFSTDLSVRTDFVNNIYGSYHCVPASELCGVKCTVIYPATEKHIEKYSICHKYVICETPDLYETVTLPYIEESQFSLDWVYNILEHKQEQERIVYEDNDPETGFILLPDLKWDGRNVENLYLLGIVHKHGIKSLRDLNESHLPLLRNLRDRSAKVISKRYGYHSTQLRMYFHYQPSFYHLHLHINPVRNDAPGIWCEKSHMLDTVINNLELLSDYYKRASLPFVLYEGNKLLNLYEQKFPVRKPIETAPSNVERSDDHPKLLDTKTTANLSDEEPERQSKRIKLTEEPSTVQSVVA
ncbi:m7GpppX diphosphatase [Scaptodrosophila lebanonensis]|uniref:m7GpppX diphosphatase n=1 Tax=Drosophila lebanonensis TaxID=7225 RepID=A0A6J2TG80_DROLE|nr:m7GpppX diphosphatase [Scaptodrosophila lebanonensis]